MFIVQAGQYRTSHPAFDSALLEARLKAYQLKVEATVLEVSSNPGGRNVYTTLRVVQAEVATSERPNGVWRGLVDNSKLAWYDSDSGRGRTR